MEKRCVVSTRKVEYSERNKDIDPPVFDEYNVLHEMAYGIEFHGVIRSICSRQFHLIYCSPEQVELLKDVVNFTDFPIVVLVLQNIVKNVRMRSYITDNIYLIIFAVKMHNKIISLLQAITEKMEMHFIISYCQSYLKSGIQPPRTVVIQYIKFLLNGISFAFNCLTFSQHNLQCYKFLLKQVSTLPSTFIQIDIFSLLLDIDQQEYFKDKVQVVKYFLIQCIIYLSTVSDLNHFQHTVISILVLILSPFSNEATENCRSTLSSKIYESTIKKKYLEYKDWINQRDAYQTASCFKNVSSSSNITNDLSNYIETLKLESVKIYESVQSTQVREANAYFNPLWFENYFKLLLTEFPAWTKICQVDDYYNTASFCASEYTSSLSEVQLPVPASEFLKHDMKKNKSLCEMGRALLYTVKHNQFDKNINSRYCVDHSCLNSQENWMGRNKNMNNSVNTKQIEDDEIEEIPNAKNTKVFEGKDDSVNWSYENSFNLPIHSTPKTVDEMTVNENIDTKMEIDPVFENLMVYNPHTLTFDVSYSHEIEVNSEKECNFLCTDAKDENICNITYSVPKKEIHDLKKNDTNEKEVSLTNNINQFLDANVEPCKFDRKNDHSYSSSSPLKKGKVLM